MVHHSGGNLPLTLTSRFASIFLIHKHFDSVVTEGHLCVAWSRQGEVLNFPRRRWKAILNQRDVSSAHSLKADSSSILGQSELLCAQTQNNLFNTGSWELVKFFFFLKVQSWQNLQQWDSEELRVGICQFWQLAILTDGFYRYWLLLAKYFLSPKGPTFILVLFYN